MSKRKGGCEEGDRRQGLEEVGSACRCLGVAGSGEDSKVEGLGRMGCCGQLAGRRSSRRGGWGTAS